MKNWFALWSRSMDIAIGAPEVIARRLAMFHPSNPWTPAAMLEAQRMLLEKVQASQESWWAAYQAWLQSAALPPFMSAAWLRPNNRHVRHAVTAMHNSLKPVSRRVNANVKRLRRKR